VPLATTTLILPTYKPAAQPVAAYVALRTLFENVCQGLSITPEQLRQDLEEGSDVPELILGALTARALRLTAKTLVLMGYWTGSGR
jgi:hypothetical protein